MKKIIILNVLGSLLIPTLFAGTAVAVATHPVIDMASSQVESDARKAATRLANMHRLQGEMAKRKQVVLQKRALAKASETPMTDQQKLDQRKAYMAAEQQKLDDLEKKVIAKRALEKAQATPMTEQQKLDDLEKKAIAKRALEKAQPENKKRSIVSRLKKFFGFGPHSHKDDQEDKNMMHKG